MGHPETLTQVPDWILSSVHDFGAGHFYRYRVTGTNLNHSPESCDRRFSWRVPSSPIDGADAYRYDTTLATWTIANGSGLDAVPESIREDLIRAIVRLDILAANARVYGARAFDDRYAIDLVIAGRFAADTVYTFRAFAPRNGVDPDRVMIEARASDAYRDLRRGAL